MVELRRGRAPSDAVRVFTQRKQYLRNGVSGTDGQVRDAYLRNIEAVELALESMLRGWGWRERVLSDRYWRIRSSGADSLRIWPMIDAELRGLEQWLDELIASLEVYVEEDQAANPNALRAILDTNVYLHFRLFSDLTWSSALGIPGPVRIILPMVVLQELDQQKNVGRKPVNQQARRVLRTLQELLEGHGRGPVAIGDQQTMEVARDVPGHVPHPVPDEELLDRAEALEGRPGGQLFVVTGDLSMRIQAEVRNLRTMMIADNLRLNDEAAT